MHPLPDTETYGRGGFFVHPNGFYFKTSYWTPLKVEYATESLGYPS